MKTQTKAIVASVVIIALCLSAVSGITYSWFSDTEETSIDVSTAVLDIDVDIGNPTCNSTIGTTATVSGGNISINNIAANAVVSIPYEVSYTTTVKTVYRISASIADADLTDYDRSNIMLNGTSIGVRDDGVMEIVEWTPLDSSNNTTTKLDMNSLVISTKSTYGDSDAPSDWSHATLKNFSIRIVAEMYQGDYPYAKLSEGVAQIPENGVVSGEANTAEGVSKGFSTTIDFSGVNQIGSSETEITDYTVTATSSLPTSNTDFKIENDSDTIVASFSLTDSTQQTVESATFDNPVTLTVIVDGDYSDANVVYLGEGDQPTILSKIYDGTNTTIVFTTTHFSDFGIFKGGIPVISETGLKIALELGLDVKLASDITVTNVITINEKSILNMDLNSKTITVSSSFTGRPFTNNGALTLSNGTIDVSAAGTNGYGIVANYGALVVNSGEYKGNPHAGGALFKSFPGSVTTINDGTFVGTGAILNNGGIATINGGTHSSESCNKCSGGNWTYAILSTKTGDVADPKQSLTINGGVFSGVQGVVSASIGHFTINGGTFNAVACSTNGTAPTYYACYAAGEYGELKTTINGGTFSTAHTSRPAVLIGNDNEGGDGGIMADSGCTVNGGTFITAGTQSPINIATKTGNAEMCGGTLKCNGGSSVFILPEQSTGDGNGRTSCTADIKEGYTQDKTTGTIVKEGSAPSA